MLLQAVLENIAETFHEPSGILRFPYLDPGGVYSNNLWDWDSLWTLKALIGIAEKIGEPKLKEKVLTHGTGAIKNFFDHQAEDGSLSILLTETDADPFACRQSNRNNMAKPVFGQFCNLLSQNSKQLPEANSWISALEKYYRCSDRRYRHEDTGLYCWATDIAIGVDDDPATWGRPPFSSANIFLNCFMYADLQAAANFAESSEYPGMAKKWRNKSTKLADSIQKFCWDNRDGIFYSVDVQCRQNVCEHRLFGKLNINATPFWKVLPLKVMTWSCFLPIWCGIATDSQAKLMVNQHLTNEKRFWSEWGIRSLSADEKMYSPSQARGNPSNWLGPVWIIANYLIWEGIRQYGYDGYATQISEKIQNLLIADYRKNKLLHENYNPETGEGISGQGFWNWNVLAYIME